MNKPTLTPNIDYYINTDGNLVFLEKFHLDRGYCCQSGCLHCPYKHSVKLDPFTPAEFRDVWGEDCAVPESEDFLEEEKDDDN